MSKASTQQMKIKSMPLDERPREKLIKHGPKTLSNSELLAIVLRTGSKGESIVDVSNKLLNKYSLKSLSVERISGLKKNLGIGDAKACQILACFELGRRLAAFSEEKKLKVDHPEDIAKVVMPEMSTLKKEHFKGIYLDARRKVIKEETIHVGSLNFSVVHPREIFHVAVSEGAAAIILLHNHPSGDPSPSKEDIKLTRELVAAGEILGIEVLDHIIIGDKTYRSFREMGLVFD